MRKADRKLKIYPCSMDGEANMSQYKKNINEIIKSVYDNAKAFSLRDRDEGTEKIDDSIVIKRFKLSCRASENLLLSNEILKYLEIEWDDLKKRIDSWVELNSSDSHSHYEAMFKFKNSGYDRKNYDLKKIRNDLMHIIGKPIAWEIAIGKTLGKLISEGKNNDTDEHSVFNYLGRKLISSLLN